MTEGEKRETDSPGDGAKAERIKAKEGEKGKITHEDKRDSTGSIRGT